MYETAALIDVFQSYGYLALFPILALGGPLAALVAGILASQGFFSPFLIDKNIFDKGSAEFYSLGFQKNVCDCPTD